ncbi:MAG TPA: von Willebrand factor type A domain-containing protein [Thermoanaerobaculia bacterium]|nr:von Willebrand factor type A domain-containing protein [Thermoanaerobaculia bacterium]
MNSKRRAELQRRLSMGAVPRPPAGLAERIKADIPKYLDAGPVPQRFAWGTTMRIAATLITLATTALVTMELLQTDRKGAVQNSASKYERPTPAVLRYRTQPATQTASMPPAETEVSLDIAQELPAPAPVAPPQERRAEAANVSSGLIAATEAAPMQVADATLGAAAPAPPPPPPPMVAAPASAPPPARAVAAERASSELLEELPIGRIVTQAYATELDLEQRDVFGISLDPTAFPTIRTAIESGTRPAPDSVDVEALVNYFAGAQSSRRDVGLEVEVSPAPIAAEGDVALLRFTVDTAKLAVPARASVPPVARDAHLHIDIDTNAVASFRRIGDSGTEESEEALLYNTSVTGLYELKLKPNLRSSQRIATVRLQYVSVTSGRKQTLTRVIRGGDLAETWDRASRRHRLAALGAVWSETLRGPKGGVEIAQRAEELATQNPQDSRARELAAAATLSTGGER